MFQMDDKSNVRILVIEDENLLREFICDYLEDSGYQTLNAPNGKIGLQMVKDEKPDLVLTDLRMPEMNGLEFLSSMQDELRETPVIVISGTGSLSDVVQTLKLGAWDYILKPISDVEVLEVAISRVLEKKWLMEENRRYREHLEEEVVKRTKELVKSTERFKTLFNFAGDLIFIFDLHGNVLNVNQKAIETLGYDENEILKLSIKNLVPESELNEIKQGIYLLEKKSHIMFETCYIHKNGSVIPIETNACFISVDGEKNILTICRNIAERKQAEEEKKLLEKQIIEAQKMESVGLLASGIAHDFNNVLTSLTGYTHLLQRRMQEGSRELEYLENISGIINMGRNLAKRITTFIRKDKEELVKVDIHKILSDTEALLRPNCSEVDITLELNAEYSEIMADEAQLQNAFLNLGINARDAMPNGGTLVFKTENGQLDSTGSEKGRYIAVSITDTGTGMSKEVMSKIFDPLFTTKEKGKGTGLGLTSVYYCVKNLQGNVDVQSETGKGTTFKIILPMNFSVKSESVLAVSQKSEGKILIVDKDEKTSEMLRNKLSALGYSTITQSNSISSVKWFKENYSSVMLTIIDYFMPLMNGIDLINEFTRIDPKHKSVIMTTQSSDDICIPTEISETVVGTIKKPFDSEMFFVEITKALSKCVQGNKIVS